MKGIEVKERGTHEIISSSIRCERERKLGRKLSCRGSDREKEGEIDIVGGL